MKDLIYLIVCCILKKAFVVGIDSYDSIRLGKLDACKNDRDDVTASLKEMNFELFLENNNVSRFTTDNLRENKLTFLQHRVTRQILF